MKNEVAYLNFLILLGVVNKNIDKKRRRVENVNVGAGIFQRCFGVTPIGKVSISDFVKEAT